MHVLRVVVVQVSLVLLLGGIVIGMEYPKEIAAEFPACNGAHIIQTMNIQGNVMVMMECSGKMEDVYKFYKKKAEGGGWSVIMETRQQESIILMGEKGEKHVVLNVGMEGSRTLVHITLGKRN